MPRPAASIAVAARRPGQQPTHQDEMWPACFEHEHTIGELAVRRLMKPALSLPGSEPLPVELRVDRVRPDLPRVERQPDVAESVVVIPSAFRARPVTRCER